MIDKKQCPKCKGKKTMFQHLPIPKIQSTQAIHMPSLSLKRNCVFCMGKGFVLTEVL